MIVSLLRRDENRTEKRDEKERVNATVIGLTGELCRGGGVGGVVGR